MTYAPSSIREVIDVLCESLPRNAVHALAENGNELIDTITFPQLEMLLSEQGVRIRKTVRHAVIQTLRKDSPSSDALFDSCHTALSGEGNPLLPALRQATGAVTRDD